MIWNELPSKIDVGDLLSCKDHALELIVQHMMISCADYNTDMICDDPASYPTKADIEDVFKDMHDQCSVMIDDIMTDIRTRLMEYAHAVRYHARVRRIEYADDGSLADVVIRVDFL